MAWNGIDAAFVHWRKVGKRFLTQISIFGGKGFVGGRLVAHYQRLGRDVRVITRDNWPKDGEALGEVIYAIGMTASFRRFPLQTAQTQVVHLHEVLSRYTYASLLYLSSTRVYRDARSTREDTPLLLRPTRPDDVYNATKLAGEALCAALENPKVRVARLANVYGASDHSEVFLTDVIREAAGTSKVLLRSAPQSAKDFIHVEDAVALLAAISEGGRHGFYNVASGINTTNEELAEILRGLDVDVQFLPDAPDISFPLIDTSRARAEFPIVPKSLPMALANVYRDIKKEFEV